MSSASCLQIRLNRIFAKCCQIRIFLPYWVKTGYKMLVLKQTNTKHKLFFPIQVFHYIPQFLFIVECHKTPHQSEILSPETNSTRVERQCIMVLSRLKLLKLCFMLVPFSRPAEVEFICEQWNVWYTIDIKAMWAGRYHKFNSLFKNNIPTNQYMATNEHNNSHTKPLIGFECTVNQQCSFNCKRDEYISGCLAV